MSSIIAVDFDGTIVDHAFPAIGKIKPYCKEVMNLIKEAGHKIIIWTCRSEDDMGQYLEEMKEWLDENEIPYDAINENVVSEFAPYPKIYYDILIDDRSLFMSDPVNWVIIESELHKKGVL